MDRSLHFLETQKSFVHFNIRSMERSFYIFGADSDKVADLRNVLSVSPTLWDENSDMDSFFWPHCLSPLSSPQLHSLLISRSEFSSSWIKNNNKHNIGQNELHNTETSVWRHLKKTVKEQRGNWWICIVLPRPQSPDKHWNQHDHQSQPDGIHDYHWLP